MSFLLCDPGWSVENSEITQKGVISGLEPKQMRHCPCAGHIPEAMGALSELRQLLLSNNQLTGNLRFDRLEKLVLAGDQLTGERRPEPYSF